MDEQKKFIRRAVAAALASAVLLFAAGGILIRSYPEMTARAAAAAARKGNYDGAFEKLARIDAQLYPQTEMSGRFRVAQAMLENGEYDKAQEMFSALEDYENSADMVLECRLRHAKELTEQSRFTEAADILLDILYYSDARQAYNECRYLYAMDEYSRGSWLIAAQTLWSIREYKDASALASRITLEATGSSDVEAAIGSTADYSPEQLQHMAILAEQLEDLRDGSLAVGFSHTVGLRSDGTVVACGDNSFGQCDVSGWSGVIQIAAGAHHTAALLRDGTVVACGDNSLGQCEVSEWRDVVKIAATDYDTAALLRDGTVVTCGNSDLSAVEGWYDVSDIFAGTYSLGCLYSGGYILSTHESGKAAQGIYASAAASSGYIIALGPDGSVFTTADAGREWDDVLSVYASPSAVGAITSGGKADVDFFRDTPLPQLPEDKAAVSMALGGSHCAVLYDDGTVFAFGSSDCGQCETGSWNLN